MLWFRLSFCVSSFLTAFDLTRYRVAKAEHICSWKCGGLLWIELTAKILLESKQCLQDSSWKAMSGELKICFVWDLHTMTCCTVNPRKLQLFFAPLHSRLSLSSLLLSYKASYWSVFCKVTGLHCWVQFPLHDLCMYRGVWRTPFWDEVQRLWRVPIQNYKKIHTIKEIMWVNLGNLF